MSTKTTFDVYNLEFPTYITELNVAGYVFRRISGYCEALAELSHPSSILGPECNVQENTGTHAITATVEVPANGQDPILPWETIHNKKQKALLDILFILSILSSRFAHFFRSFQHFNTLNYWDLYDRPTLEES